MKKHSLRLLLLSLCAALLLSVPALAAEDALWQDSLTVENPLYPASVTAGPLAHDEDAAAQLFSEDEAIPCQSEEDVVAAIRSGLEQRDETISIVFVGMSVNANYLKDHVKAYYEAALEHTGVPTQGDALRWVYKSYNVNYGSRFNGNSRIEYYATYRVIYYTTPEQEAALDTWVNERLEGYQFRPNDTVEQKVERIYQDICQSVSYDYVHVNDPDYTLKYTAYAAAIEGTAVCQGYTALFYRMLLELGIDNRVIAGTANEGDHAWTIVAVDGHYYNCDVTWDSNYYWAGHQQPRNFFMKITEDFHDHTRDKDYDSEEFHALYPTVEHDLMPYQGYPADCDDPGMRNHYICVNDGRFFADRWGDEELTQDELVVEPLGHDWGAWDYVDGLRSHICLRCGEEEQETLDEFSYVRRAYEVILARTEEDVEGTAHWVEQLQSGVSAGEIIKEFFRSEEFKNRGLSNEEIVTLCYEAMLGRAPEEAGLANWTALLDDGYSTTKLVAAIVTEPEFIQLCGYYSLTPGSVDIPPMDEKSNVTNFIRRCYTYAIGREADEGGLNDWVSQLLDGSLTPERAAFSFVFSDEVHDQELDNRGFITMLYRMMLGRRPDADGLANWVNVLDAGDAAQRDPDVVRQEAYALFAASAEFGLIVDSYGLGNGSN